MPSLTLRMYLNQERPAAVEVADRAPRGPRECAFTWWLPRRLIGDLRRAAPAAAGERPPVQFTLPAWKVDQSRLHPYVQ